MTSKQFAFFLITMCVIWLAGILPAMRRDEERMAAQAAERAVKHQHPAATCVDLFEDHNVNPPLWLLSLEEYELVQQQPLLREAARMQAEIEMYREEHAETSTLCSSGIAPVRVAGCLGLWHCPEDVYGGTRAGDAMTLCERGGVR